MKLVVVSHKPCWLSPTSPLGYTTGGGFPSQMRVISELFDETTLVVPVCSTTAPSGTNLLTGHNLSVLALDQPIGLRWRRKMSLVLWAPRNLSRIWNAIRLADAVHTPVPGDIGLIGIVFALLQKKPLFVRHCGTWSKGGHLSRRLFIWLLERIAGGRNVVFATGGSDKPPSQRNTEIRWIFATTMSEDELKRIPPKAPWRPGQSLRMITVARQEPSKNTDKIIRALAFLLSKRTDIDLDVVGTGSALPSLKTLTVELNLENRVTFHGQLSRNEVMKALSESHVFCFPTNALEGFPKAVHEALSWGLPVITTSVSVLPILIGTKNGILLDDTRPETIAEAIEELLADERRFAEIVHNTQPTARSYSLEGWQNCIGKHLQAAWHRPLKEK